MLSNNTSHEWVIDPDGRGPWDIVWSCLLTIFLCCWTSICINVQSPADGPLDRFRDKLNLAVFTIIGPDIILLLAVGQWESACQSVKVWYVSQRLIHMLNVVIRRLSRSRRSGKHGL